MDNLRSLPTNNELFKQETDGAHIKQKQCRADVYEGELDERVRSALYSKDPMEWADCTRRMEVFI